MRIVQALGWYFPDSLGGTEIYVAALAARLRVLGHEVLVAAPQPGLAEERTYDHDGIPVFRYPIPRSVSRAEARGEATARGAERLHQWLRRVAPDVVHIHTFVTGLGLAEIEAARQAGARVVVTTHAASLGFICERGTMLRLGAEVCDGLAEAIKCSTCALQQRGMPVSMARLFAHVPLSVADFARRLPGPAGTALSYRALINRSRDAQRRMLDAVSSFVVLSDWAARVLIANGAPPGKIVVNRLGIRSTNGSHALTVAPRASRDEVVAGFVGRAESIKGLDDAIRAVRSLAPHIAVRLRVVAPAQSAMERAFLESCKALAASDDRIRFEQALAPADVSALLAELDVLLCPSRAVEGGPTVALEALAVNTPVVGAAVPALTEIVVDDVNGRLHPAGDWQALAAILASIAANPAGTIDRWRLAPHVARTMDEITAEYLSLYAAH